MRRFFSVSMILISAFVLSHCGGEGPSPANASAGEEDSTGVEGVPEFKDAAITGGNVAVDAGYASDGVTVVIPTGFDPSQCKFTAALANIDGSAISTSVSIDSVTGQVTCKKVVQERVEIPAEEQGCVASYTVICVQ